MPFGFMVDFDAKLINVENNDKVLSVEKQEMTMEISDGGKAGELSFKIDDGNK